MDLTNIRSRRSAAQCRGVSASLRRLAARRAALMLGAGTLLLSAGLPSQAGTFNYTGGGAGTAAAPITGVFSNGFDSSVTSAGFADTLSFAGASYTATDDLATQISANNLVFSNTGAVTVARGGSGTSNSVSLGGTSPYVNFNNTGAATLGLDLSFASSGFLVKTTGSGLPQNGTANPIVSGGINLGTAGTNLTVALNDTPFDNAAEMALTGVISGAGSLTFANNAVVPTTGAALGSGQSQDYATLLVSGNNTYSGGTNINFGRLVVNSGSALGTGMINIAQASASNPIGNETVSGGTLALGNAAYTGHDGTAVGTITTGITLANAINLAGAVSGDYGVGIQNNQGNNTLSGVVTLTAASAAIGANGGTLTVSNGIAQASGVTASLAVNGGGGTVILAGNNTYTGTTTINNGGILQVGTGGALAGGVVTASSVLGATSGITDNGGANGGLTLDYSNNLSLDVSTITGNGRLTQAGPGTLTLTGTGSLGGYFTSNGTLAVGTGATLTGTNYSSIGVNNGDHGTLNMTGTGSLTDNGDFNAGDNAGATGTVNVGGTAALKAGNLYLGKSLGASGTLNVSGGTVTAANGGGAIQDGTGSGTGVIAQTGGTVSTTQGELWVGNGNGSNGTYTISGGSLTTGSWLAVGRQAGSAGVMNISGTASVTKGGTNGSNLTVAGDGGLESGTINQTGGSLTNTVSQTWIGENGNGAYNMSGGAANLAVLDINHAGSGATAGGVVNLSGTAVLSTTQVVMSGTQGTGTINFNGGTLQANTGAVGTGTGTFLGGLTTANVQSGGATFDTNGNSVTVTQGLLHAGTGTDGGLTKVGAGTLTLSGTDTYTGSTAVKAGTLALTTISSLGAGNLLLASSSTPSVSLLFSGTETIGALSFNLGSTYAQVGTYGAAGSGAKFTSAAFTGSGVLNVSATPEPSQYAAFGLGLLGLAGLSLKARRRGPAA